MNRSSTFFDRKFLRCNATDVRLVVHVPINSRVVIYSPSCCFDLIVCAFFCREISRVNYYELIPVYNSQRLIVFGTHIQIKLLASYSFSFSIWWRNIHMNHNSIFLRFWISSCVTFLAASFVVSNNDNSNYFLIMKARFSSTISFHFI